VGGSGDYVVTLSPEVVTGRIWPRAHIQVWTRPASDPLPVSRAWVNVPIAGQSKLIVDYGTVPNTATAKGTE